MSNLDTLMEEYTKAKRQFQQEAIKLLKQEFKSFFEDVPEVKVIKWSQYTPYFNDGDPCVFGVNDPTFSNADDTDLVSAWGAYEGDEDDGTVFAFQGTYDMPETLKSKQARLESLSQMICSEAMQDVLLDAFGDHTVVTVTPAGIVTEQYDHD